METQWTWANRFIEFNGHGPVTFAIVQKHFFAWTKGYSSQPMPAGVNIPRIIHLRLQEIFNGQDFTLDQAVNFIVGNASGPMTIRDIYRILQARETQDCTASYAFNLIEELLRIAPPNMLIDIYQHQHRR